MRSRRWSLLAPHWGELVGVRVRSTMLHVCIMMRREMVSASSATKACLMTAPRMMMYHEALSTATW
jgi:hypothetical protein